MFSEKYFAQSTASSVGIKIVLNAALKVSVKNTVAPKNVQSAPTKYFAD
jgi:hypothetical protein